MGLGATAMRTYTMFTIKLTTKGTMTFLNVKAFGRYLNMSWGKQATRKAPAKGFAYGEWTPEGYQRYMDTVTMAALDGVWMDTLRDPEMAWG